MCGFGKLLKLSDPRGSNKYEEILYKRAFSYGRINEKINEVEIYAKHRTRVYHVQVVHRYDEMCIELSSELERVVRGTMK